MFGIIFTLQNGTELAGAIMHDGNVYLHTPVVDTYNSIEDALADHPGSKHEVVGPVIGINLALNNLDGHYKRAQEQVKLQLQEIETEYHLSRRALLKYSEALEAQGKENEENKHPQCSHCDRQDETVRIYRRNATHAMCDACYRIGEPFPDGEAA